MTSQQLANKSESCRIELNHLRWTWKRCASNAMRPRKRQEESHIKMKSSRKSSLGSELSNWKLRAIVIRHQPLCKDCSRNWMVRWTTAIYWRQPRAKWSAFLRKAVRKCFALKKAETRFTNKWFQLKRTLTSWSTSRQFFQKSWPQSRTNCLRVSVRS